MSKFNKLTHRVLRIFLKTHELTTLKIEIIKIKSQKLFK